MSQELDKCSLVQFLKENLPYDVRTQLKSGKTVTITIKEITEDGYVKYERTINWDDETSDVCEGILPLNRIESAEVDLEKD
jgi:hypothetical protein